MSPSAASPVITSTRKGTAYLEIVPHGKKVRVQRTEAGRSLNRFWTVWLRKLLLEQTDPKHGFAVELRGSSILVSSSTTAQGLMETVRSLAAQITPLRKPPISLREDWTTSRSASWEVHGDVDLSECLESLELPQKSRVDVSGTWFVSLTRHRSNSFRIGELCLMVELHVALYGPTTQAEPIP